MEEPAPRLAVLPYHLLGGGRAEYAFIFAFEVACIGVPHVAFEPVFVVVPHEALIIDFVPESGGSVQEVS
ncbi:hypothetical protein C468_12417 [Halorubrum kocurii JCM 14978]|uniref:Uncharacterized protein n=1 Tax=Halorubrum kocurii JCM 14978 TaxID=1230456 RepID=M0NTF0_9EURY|nr:hypothetical protein C468_12417 [Halorubrum kocurii JCM 14978]